MHEVSVSRKINLVMEPPLESEEVVRLLSSLLLKMAGGLCINGVIPGHLKALVQEEEKYAVFNCTRPGKVMHRISRHWEGARFHKPQLYLEAVVVNIPLDDVEALVDKCLEEVNFQ